MRYKPDGREIAFDDAVIDGLLEKCGLEIVGKYDYDTVLPPKEESENIVYAAKKVK